MITRGCHVIIQKIGGEHIRVSHIINEKQRMVIEKLNFYIDGAIGKEYGLFEVCSEQLSQISADSVADSIESLKTTELVFIC